MIAAIVTIQVLLLNITFYWRLLRTHLFQLISDGSSFFVQIYSAFFAICQYTYMIESPKKCPCHTSLIMTEGCLCWQKNSPQTDCKKCGPTYISIRSKTWLKKFYSFSSITFPRLHYSYSSSVVRN